LRPNKAVDRFLFLELCAKIGAVLDINSYQYVGFGGPQMEDFRLLHERFPRLPMLCIEENEGVIPRQRFNQHHSLVDFLDGPTTSGDWLSDWRPSKPILLWFDYASKRKRNEQFNEFQTLLSKAPTKSVIRITMNADLPKEEGKRTAKEQFNTFNEEFGNLVPEDVDENLMTAAGFPSVLARMLEIAAEDVLRPKGERTFGPLLITVYRDTNQMLTITGMLDAPDASDATIAQAGLADWQYLAKDWSDLRRINMPELTVKERIHINQLLPGTSEAAALQSRLGFQVDERAEASLDKLRNYAEFYRHFPQFVRVSV
jgi:hypothetical protein